MLKDVCLPTTAAGLASVSGTGYRQSPCGVAPANFTNKKTQNHTTMFGWSQMGSLINGVSDQA
eukprot:2851231-Amphidinium_carterae.1